MANVQYSLRNTMIENLLGGVEMLLQRHCIYAVLHWTMCPKYIPLHNMLLFLFYIFAKTKCKIIHLHNRHAFWHIYSMSFLVWQLIWIVSVHKNQYYNHLPITNYIYQKLQKYKIQKVAFTTRRLVMDDVSSDVKFYFYFILFLVPLGNCATNLLECLN